MNFPINDILEENHPFVLLDEEQQLFDQTARATLKEVSDNLESFSFCTLASFSYGNNNYSTILDTLIHKLFPKELQQNCMVAYYTNVIHPINSKYVFIETNTNTNIKRESYCRVNFQLNPLKNLKVPFFEQEKIIQIIKNLYKERLRNEVIKLENQLESWSTWRNNELAFRPLRNKLPELNGIF